MNIVIIYFFCASVGCYLNASEKTELTLPLFQKQEAQPVYAVQFKSHSDHAVPMVLDHQGDEQGTVSQQMRGSLSERPQVMHNTYPIHCFYTDDAEMGDTRSLFEDSLQEKINNLPHETKLNVDMLCFIFNNFKDKQDIATKQMITFFDKEPRSESEELLALIGTLALPDKMKILIISAFNRVYNTGNNL